ncbi:hypothetical protein ACPCTO_13575 [Streptomyces olivoreticuli]
MPEYVQEPLFPDSALTLPQPARDRGVCACREKGQCGDGRVRYQARDGEFVELRCRDHHTPGEPS